MACALLWSQQMALSHSLSHLAKAGHAQTVALKKATRPVLVDAGCTECLANAQFFSVMGSRFFFQALGKLPPVRIFTLARCITRILQVFVFQPRAPPPS
ncbi:hypothetical protein LXA47_01910 [Massilia sp. P8910]|uniref:hypothetical protein n=1 Tax=Massilia antarctica TaxID=2765360 RepID=UPI001E35977C|nr:hypothetical protein [Massilia antarctica]MCE3602368.1 hypothetical protein [Massilia antarctica]